MGIAIVILVVIVVAFVIFLVARGMGTGLTRLSADALEAKFHPAATGATTDTAAHPS